MRVAEGIATLLVTLAVGNLLLGYRDTRRVHLPDQLAAFLAMLSGFAFGMLWELIEFISDWVASTDLQPSNLNSMMDLLTSNVAAIVGGVASVWVYCHLVRGRQREQLGNLASWLSDGPSKLLDRHGYAMMLAFAGLAVLAVAALWFAGRPVPGFPIG